MEHLTDSSIRLARVLGSQIQVAGWTVYSMLIWCFKLSMLFFYVRLTVCDPLSGSRADALIFFFF